MELFIFARFHVRDDKEGQASAVLRDQVKHVRDEAGCLAIDVFASVRDPQLFYLHSGWIDEAPVYNGMALEQAATARSMGSLDTEGLDWGAIYADNAPRVYNYFRFRMRWSCNYE
jgi:quinol monooxygenase YgiN